MKQAQYPFCCLVAGAIVAAAAPAAAQVTIAASPNLVSDRVSNTPKAELRITSSRRVKSTWSGKGPELLATDLCVASSTGRYRLQLSSASGGGMVSDSASAAVRYTVRFRDGAGTEQVKSLDSQAMVTFDGSSADRPDCTLGANASVEVELAEGDLLENTSGNYADRLTLSVAPL